MGASATIACNCLVWGRDTAHRALLIVCTGDRPGMGLLNAERFRHPYGAPTIHVSSDASDVVLADATRAAPARVVAESRYIPAAARNVVVAIRGSRPSSPPVVVMTPRSSWWQSTAERGGGLVCWLESLRALIAAPPACNVIFTANSGHELGHFGLDDFMARRPGWERPISEGGVTWIHFGANMPQDRWPHAVDTDAVTGVAAAAAALVVKLTR